MANPIPATFLNFPIVDPKTGRATVDFTRWLQQLLAQTVNLQLDGNINAGANGSIDPATLAAQVANLDSNGVVLPNGIDLSRAYINKFLSYIGDDATYSKTLAAYVSSGVPYNYKGAWNSATSYLKGAEVSSGGNYWLALAANTNSQPAIGNANWQLLGPTSLDDLANGSTYSRVLSAWISDGVPYNFQGVWSSITNYVKGAEVSYNSNYWLALAANTNSAPAAGNANWQLLGPTSLDDLADGSTYLRMPGSNMDSNRRGLIDFSQGAHLHKNVDNIGDGSAFARSSVLTYSEAIDNPSFEASSTILPPPGWQYFNGTSTLAYETSSPYIGSQSLKITAPQFLGVSSIKYFAVNPGDQINLSCYAKADGAGGTADMYLSWRSALGTEIGSAEQSTSSTSWTKLSITATAPAGATSFWILLRQVGAGTFTAWFDALMAVRIRQTTDVASNAINSNAEFSQDANSSSYIGEAVIGSISLTTEGGSVELFAQATCDASNSSATTFQIRNAWPGGTILGKSGAVPAGQSASLIGIDFSPPNGSSVTYYLTAQASAGTNVAGFLRIIAGNRKR